jgi:sigma-54 specific flagellar transcriptional regulator A
MRGKHDIRRIFRPLSLPLTRCNLANIKHPPSYIGQSAAAKAVRDMVARVANSTATVLITGESGTGKELVARALHDDSVRCNGNFVPINCAAIPKDLLESELFGHRKGAFTGAVADRVGRFELAHGGTIFLDEIGDLSLDMQVKLLRVLQERTIDPVGGLRPIQVNVRVVAATHRDLETEIQAGRFREDLYYRLNVLPLHTAPLRERPEDVPELLRYFAQRFGLPGRPAVTFTPEFLQALQDYPWPGNVRELSNLVDRFSTLFGSQLLGLETVTPNLLPRGLAAIQAQRCPARLAGDLQVAVLTAHKAMVEALDDASAQAQDDDQVEDIIMLAQGSQAILPPDGVSLKDRLAEIERDLISQALLRSNGNVSKTARLLNLQRTTLIEKIHKYALRTSVDTADNLASS